MIESFLTFKKFNDIELAKEIANRLTQNNIEFLLEDNQKQFDITFANNTFDPNISIKIKSKDFIKANEALGKYYKSRLDSVDNDYYLFEFTDDELFEIISKPDEWGPFDYQLSKKSLVTEERLLNRRKQNS